jgi:ribosomal protein L11 methyltransferase
VNYIELKFRKPSDEDHSNILVAELLALGFESFAEEDDLLFAYIPEKQLSEQLIREIKLLLEGIEADDKEPSLELIEDQNWNALWESNYQPVRIGDECYIRAPFHDPDPSVAFEVLLRPKMAFGTAHHETTALMIEWLLENDLEDKTVLDMGSGTGILAILAVMKGAAAVTAIDNDEWAYRNALENVELNSIENVKLVLGDAQNLEKNEAFDLVLANINKNILLRDMGQYSDALIKDGTIVFSGFYEEDLADISSEANKKGLIFVKTASRNNWVVAVFKKQ